MDQSFPYLTILIALPLTGAIILLFLPRENPGLIRVVALVISLLEFAVSLPLWFLFRNDSGDMQFVEQAPWFPEWGISYLVGIDGISLLLILLTTLLTAICVLASWNDIKDRVKEYFVAFLVLETAMVGTLASLDLVLFYIFWELMLIPMYLLIGVWGGPRRIYAAIKFFLFTMFGSVLMLLAILALMNSYAAQYGVLSANLYDLYRYVPPLSLQYWLFGAFALAFVIKVPMFPFHTWLPDAHTEAPTAGSVILAGVLLKMGTYGFLRFAIPLFPEAALAFGWIISASALIGIIYGAIMCIMQTDMKRLIAYSSVSHLGFVMLGLFAFNTQGVEGSIYQMLNHGIVTGGLFLVVGMIYERRHTRMIADFGGLSKVMPVMAVFLMIITLASIGLPGTNGFIGEFLILLGAFKFNRLYGALAATGVVLGAVYMLWLYQRVMFGQIVHEVNSRLKDLTKREVLILSTVVLLIFLMGIYPKMFFRKMEVTVAQYLNFVSAKGQVASMSPSRLPVNMVIGK